MKQIVDKLNNIAKAIDENVELPTTDLIIDSLDAITRAYGGTPSESNLIVDKLEDIEEVAHGGITPTGNIAITENTVEPLDISEYATATVNVPIPAPERHYIEQNTECISIVQGGISGIALPGVYFFAPEVTLIIDGVSQTLKGFVDSASTTVGYVTPEESGMRIIVTEDYLGAGIFSGTLIPTADTEPTAHTITIYYEGEKKYWQIVKVDSTSDSIFSAILNYYYVNDNTTYSGTMTTKQVSINKGGHLDGAIQVYPDGFRIYCVTGVGTSFMVSSAYEQNITNNYYTKQNNSNVSSGCNLAFLTYKTEVR